MNNKLNQLNETCWRITFTNGSGADGYFIDELSILEIIMVCSGLKTRSERGDVYNRPTFKITNYNSPGKVFTFDEIALIYKQSSFITVIEPGVIPPREDGEFRKVGNK